MNVQFDGFNRPESKIYDIERGGLFRKLDTGVIFMKTDSEEESPVIGKGFGIGCVEITTGSLLYLEGNEMVRPITGDITIHDEQRI